MELTHSTRRFLKMAAPVIGSAGMFFAFYQWMVKERLTDCQSFLRLHEPFIRKDVWEAYEKLLNAHNHFIEVIMWEMCEPEGLNAFLHNSRSDIYENEARLMELLRV